MVDKADAGFVTEVRSPFQVDSVPVRPRLKGTGRHAGVELSKIVAGGLAGLVLAQLMLWWIPGIGRRDPLGLAPHLPTWLNVLLPPELRPAPASPRHRPATKPALPARWARSAPAVARPATDRVSSANVISRPDVGRPGEGDTTAPPPPIAGKVGSSEVLTLFDSSPNFSAGPLNAPTYSGVQLQAALARVVTALDQLEGAVGAERQQRMELARHLYQRLCDVAQIASFVDSDDPRLGQRMNAVDALLFRIARNQSLLNLVGRTSAGWIASPARTSDGIALVGEVVRIESKGCYWESELQLSSKSKSTIRIVSEVPPSLDPRMPYQLGSHLIVLGSVLADPANELMAYPGQGPIVWCGIHREIEQTGDPATSGTSGTRTPRRAAPGRF
jgi:hypothetical protein